MTTSGVTTLAAPEDADEVDNQDRAPRNAVVLGFFTLTALCFAFPLHPSKWRTHIPGNQGDALLNLWILEWAGDHLDDGWGRLWNTSIFWPHDNTLAYSESLLPAAFLHRVLAFVVRSDVLAFNLLYLACWALSGWLTYLLARRLTGSTPGGIVAGLVYMLATPRLILYGFFQLGAGFLIPLVLLLVIRLFESKRVLDGVLLGATTAVLSLSSSYYGVATIIALALILPVLLAWHRNALRQLAPALGAAAIVGGILVAPAVYQYTELQEDPHFDREPEAAVSAHPADFLRVSPDNYVLEELPPWESRSTPESGTIEQRLFPGLVALVFGALGVVAIIRNRRTHGVKILLAFLPAAAAILVVTFGERFAYGSIDTRVPWARAFDLPGLTSIRAPARFIVFPLLVLALFAAFGVAWAFGRIRQPAVRVVVLVIAVGVLFTESAMSLQFSRVPDDATSKAVNEELKSYERGPVVELPMRMIGDGSAWPYIEMPRQYLASIDGFPRVNGYSGFAPPGADEVAFTLNTFPSDGALERLDELGVRYVILRLSFPSGISARDRKFLQRDFLGPYSEAEADVILAELPDRVRNLGRFGDAYLLELS